MRQTANSLLGGPTVKSSPDLVSALLRGYRARLGRVDQAILEIRRQIAKARSQTADATPDRRELSTTVMKLIASGRQKRRTGYRKRRPKQSRSRPQLRFFG